MIRVRIFLLWNMKIAYEVEALKSEWIKVLLASMHWVINSLNFVLCTFGASTSIWRCHGCCELLYGSLKSLLWLKFSKSVIRRRIFPSWGYYKTPKKGWLCRDSIVHIFFLICWYSALKYSWVIWSHLEVKCEGDQDVRRLIT